jgi:carboxyl-terminal processing protease
MNHRNQPTRTALWIGLGCGASTLVCVALACLAFFGLDIVSRLQTGTPSEASVPDRAGIQEIPTIAAPGEPERVAATPLPAVTALPAPRSSPPAAPRERGPQPVPPAPTIDASQPKGDADIQQSTLDESFELIRTTYVYTDYNGLNLDGEFERMRAMIASGISDAQFYREMSTLIDRFDDRHSVFMSPDEVKEDEERQNRSGGFQGIGVVTEVSRDKRYLVVLYVYAMSPAADAGIRTHDRILLIDGQPSVAANGASQVLKLRGEAGTTVKVDLQSPGAQPRVLSITRGLVVRALPVEARLLPGPKKIGYLKVPTLSEDAVYKDMRAALRKLMEENGEALDGIVLDLRNNPGGSYLNAIALLGHFLPDGAYGSLIKRGEPDEPFEVNSLIYGNSDKAPLIVLTNYNTVSFAEISAAVIQRSGRGRVFGQRTRGNIELVRSNDLRYGARLMIAEQTYRPAVGANWEGVGLQPDIEVDLDWENMTDEDDAMLKAAIAELSK